MQQTITLPYLRTSAVYIPRRDLVLSGADSLTLRVTVVEYDDPSAQPMIITGGIGGPAARLVVWSDHGCHGHAWDYGTSWRPYTWWTNAPSMLVSVVGTPQVGIGSFDFFVPFATVAGFPHRCGWGVMLSWDSGRKSELLAHGTLHVSGPTQEAAAFTRLLTDTSQPIDTDTGEDLYA